MKKLINTPKPPNRPLRTVKMTKIHQECLKYPKTQKNGRNAPKMTTTLKTFKTTKIPWKPQK